MNQFLAGWYDIPISTRFLALIDCKIPSSLLTYLHFIYPFSKLSSICTPPPPGRRVSIERARVLSWETQLRQSSRALKGGNDELGDFYSLGPFRAFCSQQSIAKPSPPLSGSTPNLSSSPLIPFLQLQGPHEIHALLFFFSFIISDSSESLVIKQFYAKTGA